MARQPQFDIPGIPQHVIQRGNDRSACFALESDYARYVRELGDAAERHGCAVHAYVLMTNHVHLLVKPSTVGAVSRMMQCIGRRYVGAFNARYRRTGTLGERRYKAALVGSARYVLTCYRYIELNPVRAGMVTTPADYQWSSYAHNAIEYRDPRVTAHGAYFGLGETADARRVAYLALCAEALVDAEIDALRTYTQQQRVWASERFQRQVEKLTHRAASVRPRRRPPSSRADTRRPYAPDDGAGN